MAVVADGLQVVVAGSDDCRGVLIECQSPVQYVTPSTFICCATGRSTPATVTDEKADDACTQTASRAG